MYATPMLLSFPKRVVSSSTTIDVSIVFPAPGMPGQKSVCLSAFSHRWNFGESRSHCPVSACRRLMKSLCWGIIDRSEPVENADSLLVVLPLIETIHSLLCGEGCLTALIQPLIPS